MWFTCVKQKSMENQSQQTQYQQQEPVGFPSHPIAPKNKRSGLIKWIIIAVIGLVLIGGAVFFVFSGGGSEEENPSPTSSVDFIQTPQPTTLPTPSPAAIDRKAIAVQVLNGTGIPGEAGALETLLGGLGYDDITTGNSSSTVSTTTMTYNSSVNQAAIAEITQLLEKTYQQVETKMSSTTGNYEISIVIGLRKGATPKPAASATSTPKATTKPSSSPSATSTPRPTATP
jgi:hypothetical protein